MIYCQNDLLWNNFILQKMARHTRAGQAVNEKTRPQDSPDLNPQ